MVQASPPAFKGVANSPPAKLPAVKASPAPAPTVCLRRAGCTCVDCAAMAGLTLAAVSQCTPRSVEEDKENEVQQQPEKDSHSTKTPVKTPGAKNKPPSSIKASGSKIAATTLRQPPKAPSPVSSPAIERGDEEPAAIAHSEPAQLEAEPEEEWTPETAVSSSADEQGPADEEEGVPAVAEESHPVMQASPPAFKGVANSPPAKLPAVKASPTPASAAAPTVCLRRAGCTCMDCAAMSGLTLAAVSECTPRSVEEDKEIEVHKTPVKTPVAKKPPSSTKAATSKSAATPVRQPPKASPVPGPAAAVKESPASKGGANSPPAKGVANSPPAKLPAVKASPTPGHAAAPPVCLRRAGCTCVDCAAMAGLLALPSAPMQHKEAQPVSSPAQAAPSSVKKCALNKSATKSVKQSPAFKAQPEFKLIASPATVSQDESEVFSPEGFDNAEALNNILEDDGLDLEDFTDLRISAVNEAMRAEMKAALAQHEAEAARTAATASVNAKPESTEDWMVLKLSAQGMAAAAAPSSSSNSSAARYTLEDVERISSFNMETLKKKMEAEISDLCRKLDEARKEAKSSTQALQDENKTLKSTMQEAEKTIDELVAVAEKEKKEAAMHLKSFTDMKSYADELETAFNGLHGRYTKLKEYYTASDSNNQV